MDVVTTLLSEININNKYVLRMDNFLPSKHIDKFNLLILENPNIYSENCNIFHNDSRKYIGIQFADLISGACFQYYENNNNEFMDIIKEKHRLIHYNKYSLGKTVKKKR
ncbi:DUF3800 domain-containing protein [Methanobrevibacter filiformis]|nr:DUF3800 domain-containing protein [Methanobrevibacter filiformis]